MKSKCTKQGSIIYIVSLKGDNMNKSKKERTHLVVNADLLVTQIGYRPESSHYITLKR